MMHTITQPVGQLQDGDVFSMDGGTSWHTCCVVLFGSVAVYTSARRDGCAPTVRVDAEQSVLALVQRA